MKFHFSIEQGSPEWLKMREAKLTGSKLKTLINGKTLTLKPAATVASNLAKIAVDKLYVYNYLKPVDFISEPMLWGMDTEPEAASIVYEERLEISPELTFKPLGFIETSDMPSCGLSPDMVLFKGDVPKVGVEIKCPNSSTHVAWTVAGVVPSDHIVQVLYYFVMMPTLEEMVFMSYDPRLIEGARRFDVVLRREDYTDKIEKLRGLVKDLDGRLNTIISKYS